jgi:hypothetical protein
MDWRGIKLIAVGELDEITGGPGISSFELSCLSSQFYRVQPTSFGHCHLRVSGIDSGFAACVRKKIAVEIRKYSVSICGN